MGALDDYRRGFLAELEKLGFGKEAAAKPKKDTRRAWAVSSSRAGRRPMRVDTLLRKEKEGTLGGYKFAHVLGAMGKAAEALVPYTEKADASAAARGKRPGDVPSRDDVGGEIMRREDGRGNAATLPAASTILYEISAQPGERTA